MSGHHAASFCFEDPEKDNHTRKWLAWATGLAVIGVLGIVTTITAAQNNRSTPQIVEVPSDAVRLKGYFWKPAGRGPFPAVLFNHGSGGEDQQHTAGRTMAEAAADLAAIFLRHGYVFFTCAVVARAFQPIRALSRKTYSSGLKQRARRSASGCTIN